MAAREADLNPLEQDHQAVEPKSNVESHSRAQRRVDGRQVVEELGHDLEAILEADPPDEEFQLRTRWGQLQ